MLLQLLSIFGVVGLTVLPCIILIAVLRARRQFMTAQMKELQPLIIKTRVELATGSLPRDAHRKLQHQDVASLSL